MLKDKKVKAYAPVKDLKRARTFYTEVLQLRPRESPEGAIAFECGAGSELVVYQSQFAGTNQASQAFWEVPDVEAEVRELRGRGVTFEEYDLPEIKTVNGIASSEDGKVAWFKDPDGNIFALVETLARKK